MVRITNNQRSEYMQLKSIIKWCAVVGALAFTTTRLMAQDNGNDGGSRGYRSGGGNWDPAQIQQRILDSIQERLGFTNEVEWVAVKPLVQKVIDAGREVLGGRPDLLAGGRSRGSSRGGLGAFLGQPSAEREALQKAVEDNVPSGQIKDLIANYKAAQKIKQARLEAAQADLKLVLSTKQEAQALLLGLVN
jgi:hypothetical protein